jgi:hypothetical protein
VQGWTLFEGVHLVNNDLLKSYLTYVEGVSHCYQPIVFNDFAIGEIY